MPLSDYLQDNFATRGIRPIAALADYYMANRQQPAMPQQAMAMDPNMGYPLTPQQEAMYAQASPRRVVQLTPEELAKYNLPNAPMDTSYSGSGADFGAEQPAPVQPQAPAQPEVAQEEPAKVYPADEHELRRRNAFVKIAGANKLADAMIQQNPKNQSAIEKSLERNLKAFIPEEHLKSFDDLPEGKAAFERVKELNTAASKSAKILGNQLKTFDRFMEAGDSEGARQYAVQSITRVLASLTGQDAEQMSEFLRRSQALLSVPEILAQTNSNSWTKDSIGILLSRLQKGDAELIAANPERWAQFAKAAVNDYATTYNEAIQGDIIDKTSPAFAKRIPGADFMKTFNVPGFEPVSAANTSTQQSPKKTPPATTSPKVIRFEMKGGAYVPIQD
jgi:hypothetical protein